MFVCAWMRKPKHLRSALQIKTSILRHFNELKISTFGSYMSFPSSSEGHINYYHIIMVVQLAWFFIRCTGYLRTRFLTALIAAWVKERRASMISIFQKHAFWWRNCFKSTKCKTYVADIPFSLFKFHLVCWNVGSL